MVKYFILIKRKASKTWLGAIPARAGVSKGKLQSTLRRQLKPGFSARIITEDQLRRLLRGRAKRATRTGLKSKRKFKFKRIKKRKVKRRR